MTLDETIKEYETALENQCLNPIHLPKKATRLGLEALRAYKLARQDRQLSPDELLPSETRE